MKDTDGYDKLKPFGFCFHGCIDGYSRRIILLEVGFPKNEPEVTAVTKCRMMWNSLRRRVGCNVVRRVPSFPSLGARERDPGKGWSLVSQNLVDDKTKQRGRRWQILNITPDSPAPPSMRHVTSVFQVVSLSRSLQGTGRRGPWERGCVACRTLSYPVHQNLSPWLR